MEEIEDKERKCKLQDVRETVLGGMGEEVEGGVLLPDQVYQEPSHGGSLSRQAGRGRGGARAMSARSFNSPLLR